MTARAAVACSVLLLAIVLVGSLSLLGGEKPKPRFDQYGDPLPEHALARIGTQRWQVGSGVQLLVCLPDGKTVLTVGGQYQASWWELETGRLLRSLDLGGKAAAKADPDDPDNLGFISSRLASTGWALSPDGKVLAGKARAGKLHLWDAASGKELAALEADSFRVNKAVFSADGKRVLSYGLDGKRNFGVRLHDLQTKKSQAVELTSPQGAPPSGRSVALAPDGKVLFVIGTSSPGFAKGGQPFAALRSREAVVRFDIETGKELGRLETLAGESLLRTVLTPDCQQVAAVVGKRVALFDPIHGLERQELQGGFVADSGTQLLISPDGQRLIAADVAQLRVAIWEIASGKLLKQHGPAAPAVKDPLPGGKAKGGFNPGALTTTTRTTHLSADGKLLLDVDRTRVRVFDLATGQERPAPAGLNVAPTALRFSGDGQSVVVSTTEGDSHWDAATGKLLRQDAAVEKPPVGPLGKGKGGKGGRPGGPAGAGLGANPTARTLSSSNGRFTLAIKRDRTMVLTDHEQKQEHKIDLPEAERKTVTPTSAPALAFSNDGRQAAVADSVAGKLLLLDTHTGKVAQTIDLPQEKPAKAAKGGGGFQGAAGFGTTRTQAVLFFSADGKLVTAAVDRKVLVAWETATGKEKHRLQLGEGSPLIRSVLLSPDGQTLAVELADGSVALWDPATGKELGRMPGLGAAPIREPALDSELGFLLSRTTVAAAGLVFSPDSKFLARPESNGTIRLWDVRQKKVADDLIGHRGLVRALAFAPDGTRLVSGSADTTVLIWEVPGAAKKR